MARSGGMEMIDKSKTAGMDEWLKLIAGGGGRLPESAGLSLAGGRRIETLARQANGGALSDEHTTVAESGGSASPCVVDAGVLWDACFLGWLAP